MKHSIRGISKVTLGVRQTETPIITRDGVVKRADNFVLDKTRGALTTRGITAQQGIGGDGKVVGLYAYYTNAGVRIRLKACGGKLYVLKPPIDTWAEIGTGYNAVARWTFATIGGRCVMTNGIDPPLTYDGTLPRTLGYPVPAACAVAYNAAAGEMGVGEYTYRVSYQYETGESNGSPKSAVVNVLANNRSVDLSVIPVDPLGLAIGRFIYRTEAGGKVEQRIHTIEDNTTTTWTDTLNDTERQAIDYPAFNDAPLEAQYIVWWDDRPWWIRTAIHPDYAYYGEIYEPNVLDPRNFFRARSLITGAVVYYNQLILLHAQGADVVSKTSDGGYRVDSKWTGRGCDALWSAVGSAVGIGYHSPEGMCLWNGAQAQVISKAIQDEMDEVAGLTNMVGAFHDDRFIWGYTKSGSSRNQNCLVADLGAKGWTTFSGVSSNVFAILDGAGDGGELWFGDSNATGKVYELRRSRVPADPSVPAVIQIGDLNCPNPFVDGIMYRWKMLYSVSKEVSATLRFSHDRDRLKHTQVVKLLPANAVDTSKIVFRDTITGEVSEYPNLIYFEDAPLVGEALEFDGGSELGASEIGGLLPQNFIGKSVSVQITVPHAPTFEFYAFVIPDVLLRRM